LIGPKTYKQLAYFLNALAPTWLGHSFASQIGCLKAAALLQCRGKDSQKTTDRQVQTMKFEFSEPYASRIGKELYFELPEPLELRTLVSMWPEKLLHDTLFGPKGLLEDRLLSHFFFFRNGRKLRLDEKIQNGDVVNVMLAATGG